MNSNNSAEDWVMTLVMKNKIKAMGSEKWHTTHHWGSIRRKEHFLITKPFEEGILLINFVMLLDLTRYLLEPHHAARTETMNRELGIDRLAGWLIAQQTKSIREKINYLLGRLWPKWSGLLHHSLNGITTCTHFVSKFSLKISAEFIVTLKNQTVKTDWNNWNLTVIMTS